MDSQVIFLVQSFLSEEDNDDEVEDDGNAESRAHNEKKNECLN